MKLWAVPSGIGCVGVSPVRLRVADRWPSRVDYLGQVWAGRPGG